jgi:hypothetical protein
MVVAVMRQSRGGEGMVEAAFIVPLLPVPQTGWRLLDHYYLRGTCCTR